MPNLTTSADIDTFMGSATNAAARTNLGVLPLAGGTLTGKVIVNNASQDALQFVGAYSKITANVGLMFTGSPGVSDKAMISTANNKGFSVVSSGSFGWDANASNITDVLDTIIVRDAAGIVAQRNGTNAQTSRVYGTYTDASNYVRASLSSSSTLVTLAAETAGTGADNVDINITTAGTGLVNLATQSASADVVLASTHTARIKIGGTEYKILLSTI